MDGGAWWAAVHGVTKSQTWLSDFSFTFHFHALEKEVATHSSVLAWRIPGTGEPGGLPSMGSQRVGHDWSDLAAAAAAAYDQYSLGFVLSMKWKEKCKPWQHWPSLKQFSCVSIWPQNHHGNKKNFPILETPVLWPPHAKSWLIGKDSDAGRYWGQEEKGTTEDEMAGWHHRLDGRESEWTPGVGDGQGGLACCDSWCRKESDTTEWLNWTDIVIYI